MANDAIKKGDVNSLPANKKICGELTGNRIIYMEDYVRTFIKGVEIDEFDEGMVGLLLGEVFEADGKVYVMIKGATEVGNAAVFKDKISFTAETWPIANGTVNQYFQGMEILGWYLVSSVITEEDLPVMEEADKESFAEDHKVFFYFNAEKNEETFFQKGGKGLEKSAGYACFYEKNDAMQLYSSTVRQDVDYIETTLEEGEEADDDLKDMVREPKEHTPLSVKRHLTLVYAMSMILIIVVLVIGIKSIAKMDEEKQTSADGTETITGTQDVPTEAQSQEVTTVADESKAEETTVAPEPTTEEPTTEEPTTAEPTTEEPTTTKAAYQEYTIQPNDTLSGIAMKFYGTGDWKKIMDYNGMTSTNLTVGAVIKIPN